jgi:hypothetical protein
MFEQRGGLTMLELTVAKLRLTATLGLALLVQCAWACPPSGFTKQQLLERKAAKFTSLSPQQLESLALALVPCLAAADPVLRDEIAFESLSAWMRSRQLSTQVATAILERLQPQLAAGLVDPTGFVKPFAALTLAEVARMDRMERFLSDPQWSALLTAATGYLAGVRDYRGFDQTEGWRHGVAHGADLSLQLAMNARASKADLDALLTAIAAQVVPAGAHFYIYGEPSRLVRATLVIAQRSLHSEQEWSTWLEAISQPAPLSSWSDAFNSQSGLAKRHNTVSFLNAFYLLLQETAALPARERVLKPLQTALARVP